VGQGVGRRRAGIGTPQALRRSHPSAYGGDNKAGAAICAENQMDEIAVSWATQEGERKKAG
jgi:hypothetical protein